MDWKDILKMKGPHCRKHNYGPIDTWYNCIECSKEFSEEYPDIKRGISSKDRITEEEYDENNPEHAKEQIFSDIFSYYKGNSAKYIKARNEWLTKNKNRWYQVFLPIDPLRT